MIFFLLFATSADSFITVANPLLLRMIVNDGILPRRLSMVINLSLVIIGLGFLDALITYMQTLLSAQVGQGLICDLRTKVFNHVQRQSVSFFTRTQTGSLVSRLNTDIIGAQQAITSLLSQAVSAIVTLLLVLAAMFYLSWQISIASLILIPLFIVPGKLIGKRLQRLTREAMQIDAEMGSMMSERFNVSGAILTKLYGRPHEESELFKKFAVRVRDVSILAAVQGRLFFIILTLLATTGTALVYGIGGALAINHSLQIGTLVAMIALLTRLYSPINQLSNIQVNVLTALVSFDRVFELLDLEPLVADQAESASPLSWCTFITPPPMIEFDRVCFRYPNGREVSLASLESIALPVPERADSAWVLHDISFHAPAGKITALVGPSGAGKTTITNLVPRLYDPNSGSIRIAGRDIRHVRLQSLRDTVGVVTQDPHLFHDTIRANLAYACPSVTEQDLIQACKVARIWELVDHLPDGLDTVVGDRGYRLSGGEKQRIAIARLLLKAPGIVILDEATAHLDSGSEAAIQLALKDALSGRTSLIIAHRLSTIRNADQILVVESGEIRESGTHNELIAAGGLYADLYRTQYSGQAETN